MPASDKDKLKRQLAQLQSKKKNLEIAIGELGEDAEESAVDWFEIELRKVDSHISTVENEITEIEAKEEAAKHEEKVEERSKYAQRFRDAQRAGEISDLPEALRKKYAEAAAAENMERLLHGN